MASLGGVIEQAETKPNSMYDKAEAMDRLLTDGIINDPLDRRSSAEKEVARIVHDNAVDDELAALMAETSKQKALTQDHGIPLYLTDEHKERSST